MPKPTVEAHASPHTEQTGEARLCQLRDLITHHTRTAAQLRTERTVLLRQLVARGRQQIDLAPLAGVTAARVSQLVPRRRAVLEVA